MKRIFFAIVIVQFFATVVYGGKGTTDTLKYSAKGIYVVLTDSAGSELSKVPMGRDVTITFDVFFISYTISFTSKEGTSEQMRYDFIKKETGGVFNYLMKDTYGHSYYVTDNLKTTGKLLITPVEQKKGKPLAFFIVENAVKK